MSCSVRPKVYWSRGKTWCGAKNNIIPVIKHEVKDKWSAFIGGLKLLDQAFLGSFAVGTMEGKPEGRSSARQIQPNVNLLTNGTHRSRLRGMEGEVSRSWKSR
ncbi:uncharacterized protein PGTG_13699 [Puccinia graminis f. sp. tritici CRL 75-36-700-3]|uniref:Uncharacterized protein n=1 Tax=Puccinia graminis f. sp. tritici (strain CRL 75-36-700-3 / race SCCL) TaxID=418459 RepID=E3KSU1_PUCGT|nr:uncharacterized protein PGTG_13699 [Puccinia graminis f. sp. tritici CRL 75-36-700-3]EFP87471.1 hypothetical protein PGTG_13699 [Puccinia graminis f. sp. tritici CRL 75-36-700-3]